MSVLTHASLHHAIVRRLVDEGVAEGKALTRAQLAEQFGAAQEEVAGALRALQDDHGVVLHPHQPEVWVIHPFSTAPTPFAVHQGGRVWWGATVRGARWVWRRCY